MSVAFLFPGQGSQFVGMLSSYRDVPCVKLVFEEASDVLNKDLWLLIDEGPTYELSLTENTQPVMLAADVALWNVFQDAGLLEKESDIWLAGHSLGEYAALVVSRAMSLEDALRAVHYRACIMQDVIPRSEGAMAAILGLTADVIVETCRDLSVPGSVVEVANFNSTLQTVIGGNVGAVERTVAELRKKGAKKVVFLDVSVPSHTSLMSSVCSKMRDFLEQVVLCRPSYPIVHNLTADVCFDPPKIRDILVGQLNSPVRWTETISFMRNKLVRRFVQCGPGDVMVGLLRKIPDIEVLSSLDYCKI